MATAGGLDRACHVQENMCIVDNGGHSSAAQEHVNAIEEVDYHTAFKHAPWSASDDGEC